jgi:hypothetical protein
VADTGVDGQQIEPVIRYAKSAQAPRFTEGLSAVVGPPTRRKVLRHLLSAWNIRHRQYEGALFSESQRTDIERFAASRLF